MRWRIACQGAGPANPHAEHVRKGRTPPGERERPRGRWGDRADGPAGEERRARLYGGRRLEDSPRQSALGGGSDSWTVGLPLTEAPASEYVTSVPSQSRSPVAVAVKLCAVPR